MNAWNTLAAQGAPGARALHGAVWSGSALVVWGGLGASAPFADGARLVGTPPSWSALSPVGAPEARSEHTMVLTTQHVLIWGGLGQAVLGSGAAYSLATDTWTALPSQRAPTPRTRHTAIWTGSEMIVWGGSDGTQAFADGASFTPP
jgi:hypothetical protein